MQEIIQTLILTFLLVVIITYLFLQDWRATIIPSVTIPVSLIGTFLFLYLLGMSINTLTMFALILVIGSVVDDAICVTENCTRLIDEEHLSPFDAAMKSMQQLTGALIATTLVVVAVYMPIMFYGGMVGTIYKQFAVTMCIALCLSTVNAMTLSPALCALVLRPSKTPRGFFRLFNIGLHWTRSTYLAVGGLLVRRGLLTIVLFALILFGNYYFFNRLPSAFLPTEDSGRQVPVLIPCGIDQDPHFRITRDVAPGLGYPKPSLIFCKMCPGLSGGDKMSSSDENATIFTTDTPKAVKKKVGRAFTGGCVSVEEQREKGGNPEVCSVFKYNYYLFEHDDAKLNELADKCRNGEILCGECKMCLTERINVFLEQHQDKREKAKDVVAEMAYDGFEW